MNKFLVWEKHIFKLANFCVGRLSSPSLLCGYQFYTVWSRPKPPLTMSDAYAVEKSDFQDSDIEVLRYFQNNEN